MISGVALLRAAKIFILFENARADLHGSLFSRYRSPLPGASIPIVPLSQPSLFLLGLFKGNTRVEIPASFGRKSRSSPHHESATF